MTTIQSALKSAFSFDLANQTATEAAYTAMDLGHDFEGKFADGLDKLVDRAYVQMVNPNDVQTPASANGTLYVQGETDVGAIDFDDVRQGGMGDCYLLASLAAMANQNPNAIKNAITENRNANGDVESYTVRLYQRDAGGVLRPQDINVDAREFSQNAAQNGDVSAAGNEEIWVKIVEKAYAQAKGGYGAIGSGGWPEDATEALTGVNANSSSPSSRTFAGLQADLAAHKPVTVWTSPGQSEAGLVGNHAYAVVDAKVENGVEMVKLYNPWGGSHPGAVDGSGDGGWITFEQYQNLLAGETVGAPVDDASLAVGRLLEQIRGFGFLFG